MTAGEAQGAITAEFVSQDLGADGAVLACHHPVRNDDSIVSGTEGHERIVEVDVKSAFGRDMPWKAALPKVASLLAAKALGERSNVIVHIFYLN
jgi:hypothetical protein